MRLSYVTRNMTFTYERQISEKLMYGTMNVCTPVYSWFGRLVDHIGEPNTPIGAAVTVWRMTLIGLPRGPGNLTNQL